ncbi:hypothetical protein ACOME3_005826 [Neoechinorhynchus agilis]
MSMDTMNGRISEAFLADSERNRKKFFFSESLSQQICVEATIEQCFLDYLNGEKKEGGLLRREQHLSFLFSAINHLPEETELLDASKPWIVYWVLHSISLLKDRLSDEAADKVIRVLNACQNDSGGFGGGPGQISNLAGTYAAVNAIAILGRGYDIINRPKLIEWLKSLKNPKDHSFFMHDDGEADIRAVYCTLSVCRLLNIGINDGSGLIEDQTLNYILSCQTYEGGFAGSPGCEAHGGYTFCGLAALAILGKIHLCNFDSALRWAAMRQMAFEGGFQGRTNKLVDGCYSFWVGAIFHLLEGEFPDGCNSMFDRIALQEYILHVCQDKEGNGGLIDKPGK